MTDKYNFGCSTAQAMLRKAEQEDMTQKKAIKVLSEELKYIEDSFTKGCAKTPKIVEWTKAVRVAIAALERPVDAAFAKIFESARPREVED